jgi:hypothetical protein
MAYTINRTNGDLLTTVTDGSINTDTSLRLVGKNYAGYGEFLNENYIQLLENFSNSVAPTAPISGQLWWDSTSNRLKAYTGIVWKNVQTSYQTSSTPGNAILGDLWWDANTGKLMVYAVGGFVEVGGPGINIGSVVSVDTIVDTASQAHQVVRFLLNNITVAIISRDATFTPNPAIVGFATIVPGMNLSATISGIQLTGKSANADLLDNIDSTGFIRKNLTETTTGGFSVLNDTGISVGVDSDFSATVTGNDVVLRNKTLSGDLNLVVNRGGVATTALNIDGATGNILPGTSNLYDIGSSAMRWSSVHASNFVGNATTATNAVTAANVAYSGLTGTVPTWNQSTTGNAATATNVAYSGLTGTVPIWNQSTTGNAATATNAQNLTGGRSIVALGSAQAPSLAFNEPGVDTGFYSPGDNRIGISTLGVARGEVNVDGFLQMYTGTGFIGPGAASLQGSIIYGAGRVRQQGAAAAVGRLGGGHYRVYHNLGTTDYAVVLNITEVFGPINSFNIFTQTVTFGNKSAFFFDIFSSQLTSYLAHAGGNDNNQAPVFGRTLADFGEINFTAHLLHIL